MPRMDANTMVTYVCHTDDQGRVVELHGSDVDGSPTKVGNIIGAFQQRRFDQQGVKRIVVERDGEYMVLIGTYRVSKDADYIPAPTRDAAVLTALMT